jgi:hypothetical protein
MNQDCHGGSAGQQNAIAGDAVIQHFNPKSAGSPSSFAKATDDGLPDCVGLAMTNCKSSLARIPRRRETNQSVWIAILLASRTQSRAAR